VKPETVSGVFLSIGTEHADVGPAASDLMKQEPIRPETQSDERAKCDRFSPIGPTDKSSTGLRNMARF